MHGLSVWAIGYLLSAVLLGNVIAGTASTVAQMNSDQRNAAITQLPGRRVTDGDLPQADRDRLSRPVAAEYGINPDEATRRLQRVEQQATETVQAAERKAREAADAAATAGTMAAYWYFAALLPGAVAAVLGTRMGTRALVTVRRHA